MINLILIAATLGLGHSKQPNPPYKDPKLPVEQRVNDLIKRMTLEEKLNQLRCDVTLWQKTATTSGFGETLDLLRPMGNLEAAKKANDIQSLSFKSRLGIPIVIHDEALHGLIAKGTTSFPQSIAMAASWDPELVSAGAAAIAEESAARGVHHVLAPVINVIRDARWGRVEETYGEDPLLTSRLAVAYVKSFESRGVATTPKHFVDNAGDGGRDSHSIQISERALREIYLPPFEAAVKDGGASSIMSAYNSLNGVACSANEWLLTELLRKEWGFQGWVASDYGATAGILELHHNAGTPEEAAALGLNAGLDSEWPGVYIWGKGLDDAVKHGLISQANIDQAVRRVLRVKFKTGVFDKPFADPEHVDQIVQSPQHRQIALDAARKVMTLLKNANGTLPLQKNLGSIALIGPYAKGDLPLGGYSGTDIPTVSVYDGIRATVSPSTKVEWLPGSSFDAGTALPDIPAMSFQDLKGEYFSNVDLAGEPKVVRNDPNISFDWDQNSPDPKVPREQFSVRWTGKVVPAKTGTVTFTVTSDDGTRLWLNGVKLLDDWTPHSPKTSTVTFQCQQGVPIDLRLEYFQGGGGAVCKLGWDSLGKSNSQIDAAVELANRSDVTIIVAGIIEGEGQDRAHLDLPGNQEELIQRVSATGKPVVVVLLAGAPVTMEHWLGRVPAVLDAWYPGQEGGTAIAETLFGDNNPGGRLPITFPLNIGQVPNYYALEPSGRGYDYVDLSGKPQFPFGFGLSYTSFQYSDIKVTPDALGPNQPVTVSFEVKNTGKVKGDEVPQLYLHQAVSSIVRPLKLLVDFQRITLQPGEAKTVQFTLKPDQLKIWNARMKRVIEPGKFEVMVGDSAEHMLLTAQFVER